MQPIMFKSVVFPPPEGPRRIKNSPFMMGYCAHIAAKKEPGGHQAYYLGIVRNVDLFEGHDLLVSSFEVVCLANMFQLNGTFI
eukprot:22456-Hanusia_phi.AAC.5